ncbi:hypothetical protein L083_6746 [Actinoplanes sp. N902-109]|nr:hypothetical protein L083_6746 [Actinoplanes sp. N902-109]
MHVHLAAVRAHVVRAGSGVWGSGVRRSGIRRSGVRRSGSWPRLSGGNRLSHGNQPG